MGKDHAHECACFLFLCSATAGDIVLNGADLILAGRDMEVTGNVECSAGGCPDTEEAKATLYEVDEKEMCSGAPPAGGDGDVCAASVRSCWQIYCQ